MNNPFPYKYYTHFSVLQTIKIPKFLYHIAFLLLFGILIIVFTLFFTPWTQTASGIGTMTTLNPHDRTQNITALVKGRINKWYVQEGAFVKKGDPLVEIIDNDVNFVERLTDQRNALKYSYDAARIAAETAKLNYDRQSKLFSSGIVSRLDVEKAKIEYKKYISEQEKIQAKLQQSESKVSRQEAQLLRSPRDGVVIRIIAGNLATSVKSGDTLAILVPSNISLAVSLYVRGNDIALVRRGRKVRLQFEGWPSVQFSGWPSTAIGTFGGIVHSVDPTISDNGLFRILIKPDPTDSPWPDSQFLHYGARVKGWVLLDNVKLGYELWRQLNAFPPEFPKPKVTKKEPSAQKP